jgi:hypothetical protein
MESMSQNPNLFLSVGKQIKDEYGRVIGKIASFAVTPSGKFDAVFIELGDGKFLRDCAEHLKFDGADITLVSRIKAGSTVLCDQIPLIWRKDQALKDLLEKKKIPKEFYGELHSSFDGVLTQLKNEAQALKEEIEDKIATCEEETKALNYALVYLEIEHEIGKMDNQYYETALSIIQDNIKRVHMEKNDLELMKSKLSSILLGDALKPIEQLKGRPIESSKGPVPVSVASGLPEPPVVVYVKEIGKAGL